MKNKLILAINYINLVAALYLAATSIYYYHIQKIGFILFFSSYFIEIFLEKKWKTIQFNKKTLYFVVLIFFFSLALIYYPFDSEKYFMPLMNKRFSLFGFGIVGLFGVNNKFKLSYFLNVFVISSVIAIVYVIVMGAGFSDFFRGEDGNTNFLLSRIEYVNHHMMFNFFLNISFIGVWYILSRRWKLIHWSLRLLYLLSTLLIVYTLAISEGRSGFLAGIFISGGFIFYEIWRRNKKIGFLAFLIIPMMLVYMTLHQNRISGIEIKSEQRLFLWNAAIPVIKEKPLIGRGISKAQERYDTYRTEYQTDEFRDYIEYSQTILNDCHNQYLQTTMEFGILGLLLLLFIYAFPLFVINKQRRILSILFMFLCMYQSVFDMFITGQFSGLFCILIICLFSVENDVIRNNQMLED